MNMESQKGFTLVELLITMVVVSILLATAVPSFMQFIKNNRVTGQSNSFVVSTHMARNEAVKRGAGTTMCAANADMDACSGSNDWSTGWIVFSDLNRDGIINTVTATATSGTTCLETEDCLLNTVDAPSRSTLSGNETPSNDPVSEIRFLPTGQTSSEESVIFLLEADDCEHRQKRSIIITRQGHTTVTEQPCTP
jgi:type IV fimbrial biogenesis protein FimT